MLFNFLKRKKNQQKFDYKIDYNTNPPSRIYEVSNDEKAFFDCLFKKSQIANLDLNKYTFHRLSDGTINVCYDYHGKGGFVGKIKLQGKRKYIMYLKNLYDSITCEGEVEICVEKIDFWTKYINKYLRK